MAMIAVEQYQRIQTVRPTAVEDFMSELVFTVLTFTFLLQFMLVEGR